MRDPARFRQGERVRLALGERALKGRAQDTDDMRLRTVSLLSPSPARCAEFHARALGLPVAMDRGVACIAAGTTALEFHRCEGVDWAPYHFAFNIAPNLFEDARRWLAERVELLAENGNPVFEFATWNARALYFKDADGNIVEFIARRDLPAVEAQSFGPEHILCVSEIGIVVPDVCDAVDFLAREFRLPRYSGNDGTFAAVGDVHGLIIAVPPGRVWYPTKEMRAAATPHRIAIAGMHEGSAFIPGTEYRVESQIGD